MAFDLRDLSAHTVSVAFALKGVSVAAPQGATFVWAVSDPAVLVLTPSDDGLSATFTGVANGPATITFTATRGSDTVTGTLDVVVDLFPDSVVLSAV